ncbi:hypothetical protein ABMA28_011156 [Loxostege sticticalis]|uniref:Uncharacterized protein n=1 Tax=Loxostege sticticalis TaxID=481309 RepID=A0ABD0S6X3_LOXSC
MSYLLKTITRKLLTRPLTTSPILKSCRPTKYQPQSLVKLKKLQAQYQCEDGRPIWLKAGIFDRVLYSSTILGCCTGVMMVLSTIYENAKPPSWKTATC